MFAEFDESRQSGQVIVLVSSRPSAVLLVPA
jgi:hypothetical protein